MPEQYNESSHNPPPETYEQSDHELLARHGVLDAEMKNLLDEEKQLIVRGFDRPINLGRLEEIHLRQDEVISEQRRIERELGKRQSE